VGSLEEASALAAVLNAELNKLFPELDNDDAWSGTRRNLVLLAKRAWEVGKQMNGGTYSPSDWDATDHAYDYARDVVNSPAMVEALNAVPFQMRWIWGGRWYDSGMPRIVWEDQRYPEVLMATSADPSTAALAKPPWRAFLVDLPRELVFSRSYLGELVELVQVLVLYTRASNGENNWAFMAEGPDSNGVTIQIWRHGLVTERLLEVDPETHNPEYSMNLDDRDDRTFLLLGRLLVGLCLTLSDPNRVREAKHTKSSRSAKRKKARGSGIRNFVVGAPTKLKVRPALKEFMESGKMRNSPTVQSLVRGHWKMQPHGPGAELRKLIFREPFWSPRAENLPAVIRDRIVADD